MADIERAFPLFPLDLVALPSEVVPLHIFEERYIVMIEQCLANDSEFGIIWRSEEGLRDIGCACTVAEVLERAADGRLNILTRGSRVLRVIEQQNDLPYPAGVIEFLDDHDEAVDSDALAAAHAAYAALVFQATEREPDPGDLSTTSSYEMAATVDFGLEAKQGLLDLRSENARLILVARLLLAATKRLDFVERAQVRAKSNGKVRFG